MEQTPSFCLKKYRTDESICLTDYKEKPVLIHLWVAWCPDCIREIPLIEQFHRSISSDDFVILTVNVTGREGTTEQRDKFIKNLSLSVPVLIDEGTTVYDQFGCQSVPTTILLDRKHNIIETYTDRNRFQDILSGISKQLAIRKA
ncbi:TlpA disulfide reductase family protein [Pseudalkalibacillus decolorationis]|uniref:TlpA disulfide reductase family protein n=1 Tax=Pseudalkalibacillus decolorationis TaxID=163879 RepID=UPI00214893F4|nr:TlpA disulfide reductase family protein [Pseudalkalibacillus decolorationis]